jgi:hypothetical protein
MPLSSHVQSAFFQVEKAGAKMAKVTVYKVKIYQVATDG